MAKATGANWRNGLAWWLVGLLALTVAVPTAAGEKAKRKAKEKEERADGGKPGAFNPVVDRTNPFTTRVRVELKVKCVSARPSVLVVNLPLPMTNQYQDIKRLGNSGGEVKTHPETGDEYLSIRLEGKDTPKVGGETTLFHEFEVTQYDIKTDFWRIGEVRPYDKSSDLYRRYTQGKSKEVDPTHPGIQRIVGELRRKKDGPVDFARRAYEYVGDKFNYLGSGEWLEVGETLKRNGGHCGQLSAVFISVLRAEGIPARHCTGIKLDGKPHIWAEFYVQDYGWIPVDVTFRVTGKKDDFFGDIRRRGGIVILSRDVGKTVDGADNDRTVGYFQTYQWSTWYTKRPYGRCDMTFYFNGRLFSTNGVNAFTFNNRKNRK